MARPKLIIDVEKLRVLSAHGNTVGDMALILKVSKDTLERRFAAIISEGRAQGKAVLRASIYEQATKKGNPIAMRLLAMDIANMSDKSKVETEVNQNTNITYKTEWGGAAPEDEAQTELTSVSDPTAARA